MLVTPRQRPVCRFRTKPADSRLPTHQMSNRGGREEADQESGGHHRVEAVAQHPARSSSPRSPPSWTMPLEGAARRRRRRPRWSGRRARHPTASPASRRRLARPTTTNATPMSAVFAFSTTTVAELDASAPRPPTSGCTGRPCGLQVPVPPEMCDGKRGHREALTPGEVTPWLDLSTPTYYNVILRGWPTSRTRACRWTTCELMRSSGRWRLSTTYEVDRLDNRATRTSNLSGQPRRPWRATASFDSPAPPRS